MYEIVYKLYFFMMLVIFFSFGFLIRVRLEYWKHYHGLDFISINKDYQIKTGTLNYKTKNIIYLNSNYVPIECQGSGNKNSVKCLAKLKEIGGVYNGLAFFSGDKIVK